MFSWENLSPGILHMSHPPNKAEVRAQPLMDYSTCHTTKTPQECLEEGNKELQARTWPPDSPDANPIEQEQARSMEARDAD